MVSAYLVADIEVLDKPAYAEYISRAPATVERFGGRYVARGGDTYVLEGDWIPNRAVILEFPDMERLLAWYNSPDYARVREIRQRSANSRIVAVAGT